ncbi:TspO/MBR family protein [Chloroflexota bacterium]
MNTTLKLVVSIIACQGAGLIGAIFTTHAIPTWYAALEKPAFTPPNWLFAPTWTLLYLLMGIAAFLVWRHGLESRRVRVALIIFLIQLVLNALWSMVFFGLQSPFYGIVVIILLCLMILLTLITFFRVTAVSGWLLLPYLLWTTFAAVLNISAWLLNP